MPGLSFCIITDGKRRSKLARLIRNIRAEQIPDYEIVVAGETKNIVRESDMTLVSDPVSAKTKRTSSLRNAAAEVASKPWLVFSDDDFIIVPGWFPAIELYFEIYDFVVSRIHNRDGTRYWDWACCGPRFGQKILDYNTWNLELYVTSGFFSLRKRVWLENKWDESLLFREGQDVEYSQRLIRNGYAPILCLESLVVHDDPYCTRTGDIVGRRSRKLAGIMDILGMMSLEDLKTLANTLGPVDRYDLTRYTMPGATLESSE